MFLLIVSPMMVFLFSFIFASERLGRNFFQVFQNETALGKKSTHASASYIA